MTLTQKLDEIIDRTKRDIELCDVPSSVCLDCKDNKEKLAGFGALNDILLLLELKLENRTIWVAEKDIRDIISKILEVK